MAINDIFELGRMGLNANRKAMQTVSNNVANSNTVGYSRQRAVFEPNESRVVDGVRIGGGVEVRKVVRVHDEFVQNQILQESKAYGALKMKVQGLQQAENLVSREGNRVTDLMNKFFNDFRELSLNPETASLRTLVQTSTDNLGIGIKKMNDSLEALKADLDLRLDGTVNEINTLTKEIASLNHTINNFENYGQPPNELYDRRDQAMRDLSEKIAFDLYTDERGQLNLVVANGTLVSGTEANQLYTLRTPGNNDKTPGTLDIFMKENLSDRNITHKVKDGLIGGLIHVRDNIVSKTQESLDHVAYQLSHAVNFVHRQGMGLDGQVNHDLFKDVGEEVKGAAYRFGISDEARMSAEAIATGFNTTQPGDNSIALGIADVQNRELLPTALGAGGDVRHTLNQAVNSIVAEVGTHAAREDQFFRHQEMVVQQLDNYRQSISGVSLEEEAINMMNYQLIFNASAKAMKVGDEMMQTILSIKD